MPDESLESPRTQEQIDQEYGTHCQQYGHNVAVIAEMNAANEELMESIRRLRSEGKALQLTKERTIP